MRVILKQDVENLGSKGDIVDVAPGFGRNYLIPRRLALEVTSSNMKMIEIERQALKKRLEKERLSYEELIQKLNQVTLSFKRKAGEKDIIFGSVSSSDIKDALHELGFEIDKKKILLEEPIKRLGNYTLSIKIFQEDQAEIKVEIIKEEKEVAEEKGKKKKALEKKKEEVEEARAEPEEELKKEEEEKKGEKEKVPEEDTEKAEGDSGEPEKEERDGQEEKKAEGEMVRNGKKEEVEAEEERKELKGEKAKKEEEVEKEKTKK